MSISTTINSSTWNVDLNQVIYELLTDDNCFGQESAGNVLVVPYTTMTNKSLVIAKCEYRVVNAPNESIGAGAKGTNAVFQYVFVEITIKDSEREKFPGRLVELELDRKSDTLTTFYRSSEGRPLLGNAGFRNTKLEGPIPNTSKHFYARRFILSGRIEVG